MNVGKNEYQKLFIIKTTKLHYLRIYTYLKGFWDAFYRSVNVVQKQNNCVMNKPIGEVLRFHKFDVRTRTVFIEKRLSVGSRSIMKRTRVYGNNLVRRLSLLPLALGFRLESISHSRECTYVYKQWNL